MYSIQVNWPINDFPKETTSLKYSHLLRPLSTVLTLLTPKETTRYCPYNAHTIDPLHLSIETTSKKSVHTQTYTVSMKLANNLLLNQLFFSHKQQTIPANLVVFGGWLVDSILGQFPDDDAIHTSIDQLQLITESSYENKLTSKLEFQGIW